MWAQWNGFVCVSYVYLFTCTFFVSSHFIPRQVARKIVGEKAHIYRDGGGLSDNFKADRLVTMSVYLSVPIKCGHNKMDLYMLHRYIYLVVTSLSVITSSQDK